MKNYITPLFFIFLSPLFLAAQTNYQPGVVVNLQGDTLRGLINYSEWDNNPSSISFKPDLKSAPLKFTVNDLKYFNVDVGHLAEYQRYEGPITMNDININRLLVGRDSSYSLDTVFLKVLQKGNELVLFSYADNLKTRYFISEKLSDQPKELIYRIYYNKADENGRDRTQYESSYKGQLYEAAVKAGVKSLVLKKDIQKADYNEENLVYIASKINGISETDVSKNNPTKHKPFLNIAIAIAGLVALIMLLHSTAPK